MRQDGAPPVVRDNRCDGFGVGSLTSKWMLAAEVDRGRRCHRNNGRRARRGGARLLRLDELQLQAQ